MKIKKEDVDNRFVKLYMELMDIDKALLACSREFPEFTMKIIKSISKTEPEWFVTTIFHVNQEFNREESLAIKIGG